MFNLMEIPCAPKTEKPKEPAITSKERDKERQKEELTTVHDQLDMSHHR